MKKLQHYQFITSKTGRDKGTLYVLKEQTGEYVYLVNGTSRTLECPKRKNKRHIQPIHTVDNEITQKLQCGEEVLDREIRDAIIQFRRK